MIPQICYYNQPTNTGLADLHMLDVIVCSKSLHKHVLNCCSTLDGLDSNHRAVQMDQNLTSIKYKMKKSMNHRDIDWRNSAKKRSNVNYTTNTSSNSLHMKCHTMTSARQSCA